MDSCAFRDDRKLNVCIFGHACHVSGRDCTGKLHHWAPSTTCYISLPWTVAARSRNGRPHFYRWLFGGALRPYRINPGLLLRVPCNPYHSVHYFSRSDDLRDAVYGSDVAGCEPLIFKQIHDSRPKHRTCLFSEYSWRHRGIALCRVRITAAGWNGTNDPCRHFFQCGHGASVVERYKAILDWPRPCRRSLVSCHLVDARRCVLEA